MNDRPTNVRYLIVAITAFAAMWMYIDRVCFSTLSPQIAADLGVDSKRISYVLGAFFLTYAVFQVPIGALADRYGPRLILTVSIAAWSICTAATAFVGTAIGLMVVRLALGACESGAYPASAGLVRKWSSPTERGRLSSIVAFGGRIGGAIAPAMTVLIAITWLGDPESRKANWRTVFLIYGLAGLVVAVAFWMIVRNSPKEHPWANAAEADRVPAPIAPSGPAQPFLTRFLAVVMSPNMWLFGATQFCVNVGWVFLITSMPAYLKEQFNVPSEDIGNMQSVPLIASCFGMAFGGLFTDMMYRKLGPRWGRSFPIAATLLFCAGMYFLAMRLNDPWSVVIALACMAFAVDVSVPCIWAFAQDVGGRSVGTALGWGNMWGNIGAAVSPVALVALRDDIGWTGAFAVCAGCFVAAAGCGLSLNATVPIGRANPGVAPQDASDYGEPGSK